MNKSFHKCFLYTIDKYSAPLKVYQQAFGTIWKLILNDVLLYTGWWLRLSWSVDSNHRRRLTMLKKHYLCEMENERKTDSESSLPPHHPHIDPSQVNNALTHSSPVRSFSLTPLSFHLLLSSWVFSLFFPLRLFTPHLSSVSACGQYASTLAPIGFKQLQRSL